MDNLEIRAVFKKYLIKSKQERPDFSGRSCFIPELKISSPP